MSADVGLLPGCWWRHERQRIRRLLRESMDLIDVAVEAGESVSDKVARQVKLRNMLSAVLLQRKLMSEFVEVNDLEELMDEDLSRIDFLSLLPAELDPPQREVLFRRYVQVREEEAHTGTNPSQRAWVGLRVLWWRLDLASSSGPGERAAGERGGLFHQRPGRVLRDRAARHPGHRQVSSSASNPLLPCLLREC